MTRKLIDAAETLLRSGDVSALTASAVTTAAGIARNSLYRYVDSVEDLRAAVVARHLPGWLEQVEQAVAQAETAEEKLVAYLESNLSAAAADGHGWLMSLAKGLPAKSLAEIAGAHESLGAMLATQCHVLDPTGGAITVSYVQAILEASFARLDAGDDPQLVAQRCVQAVQGLLAARISVACRSTSSPDIPRCPHESPPGPNRSVSPRQRVLPD